jgi:hypothetical protein
MLLLILGATLNFYTNDVTIKRADSTIIPTIGMEIMDNDTIISNDSSQAEIIYSDSSTLYIDENSKIATSGIEKRSVFISIGRIWAKVKKLVKGESFEVKSPLSVSGVMGTEFEVSYMNDESLVKIIEGKVNTKDNQTGKAVMLEKERMVKIRRNMQMEVKIFKLQELKKWHEWKQDHLDFLIRKIEHALRKGRTMQAARLITQGEILAKRLKLTDEYKHKIDILKEKYEIREEKQGLIDKKILEINNSYNNIMQGLNIKEPKVRELSARTKRLSLLVTELEGYATKTVPLISRQQLKIIERQIKETEDLIKSIKPQLVYEWHRKLDNDYKFLQNAKNMINLDANTIKKVQITSTRVEILKDRAYRVKTNLTKDMHTYRKIKLKLLKLKIEK